MYKKKISCLMLYLLTVIIVGEGLLGCLTVEAAERRQDEKVSVKECEQQIERKRVYYVRKGECLSTIAAQIYGDSSCWNKIYEANKEIIGDDPNYLPAHIYLELPEVPEKGMTWEELFEKAGQEYEFDIFGSYIAKGLPYQIEECYYRRNTEDEKYGKWEEQAGKYDICYPQFISLDGKDMTKINETVRMYGMHLAEEMYADQDGIMEAFLEESIFRDVAFCTDTVGYQITYMDDSLLSIVFEHYYNYGNFWTILDEKHILDCLIINLETGHVYNNSEIFYNTKQLAKEHHERMLQAYTKEDAHYDFLKNYVGKKTLVNTLNADGWINNDYKTDIFLDKEGVNLVFHYDIYFEDQLWDGLWQDYEVTKFAAEEILPYQTNSVLWKKWNSNLKEKLNEQTIYWTKEAAYYLDDIEHPYTAVKLGDATEIAPQSAIKISNNGKYIYYKESWSVADLYRAEIKKIKNNPENGKANWELIAQNVDEYHLLGEGNSLVYCDDAKELFYYDEDGIRSIAKAVEIYEPEPANTSVKYVKCGKEKDTYEYHRYYLDEEKDVMLVNEAGDYYTWYEYGENLFYRKKEATGLALYTKEVNGKEKLISENVEYAYPAQDKENSIFYLKEGSVKENTYDLYYWERIQGTVKVAVDLQKRYIWGETNAGGVFWRRQDGQVCYSMNGKVQELAIEENSDIFDLELSIDGKNLMISYSRNKDFRKTEEVGEDISRGPKVYKENNRVLACYSVGEGVLKYKEKLTEKVDRGCWYEEVYYYTEIEEAYQTFADLPKEYRVKLYFYKEGKKNRIGEDVILDDVTMYDDGSIIACIWDWDDNYTDGSKIYRCGAKGESILIAKEARTSCYVNDNCVFYTERDKLYCYTTEEGAKLIAEDVVDYETHGGYLEGGF